MVIEIYFESSFIEYLYDFRGPWFDTFSKNKITFFKHAVVISPV